MGLSIAGATYERAGHPAIVLTAHERATLSTAVDLAAPLLLSAIPLGIVTGQFFISLTSGGEVTHVRYRVINDTALWAESDGSDTDTEAFYYGTPQLISLLADLRSRG